MELRTIQLFHHKWIKKFNLFLYKRKMPIKFLKCILEDKALLLENFNCYHPKIFTFLHTFKSSPNIDISVFYSLPQTNLLELYIDHAIIVKNNYHE